MSKSKTRLSAAIATTKRLIPIPIQPVSEKNRERTSCEETKNKTADIGQENT
jgi:hypothetical protein